jgi:hypothetical protein
LAFLGNGQPAAFFDDLPPLILRHFPSLAFGPEMGNMEGIGGEKASRKLRFRLALISMD